MAISLKNLGLSALGTSPISLYTVPASTSALIKTITLVNNSINIVTVNLAISGAGASAYILPPSYNLDGSAMLSLDNNLSLEPGHCISGWAGTIGVIQYVIHGVEER